MFVSSSVPSSYSTKPILELSSIHQNSVPEIRKSFKSRLVVRLNGQRRATRSVSFQFRG